MTINFDIISGDAARVVRELDHFLPNTTELDQAMRHAVLKGGKRIRAHLVYEGARICCVDPSLADYAAMAIELMHAYSLVHDDLPAMDDDSLRRGQPTIHVKWNEWTAILAGDLLQAKSFEALANCNDAELILKFAHAANDMARGQYIDLAAEKTTLTLDFAALQEMQAQKTGSLIVWSASFAAYLAQSHVEIFESYGWALGSAFQIWDDVLDVIGDPDVMGKTAGKDQETGKATYVSNLGLDGAKQAAREKAEEAKATISILPNSSNLVALADFSVNRQK